MYSCWITIVYAKMTVEVIIEHCMVAYEIVSDYLLLISLCERGMLVHRAVLIFCLSVGLLETIFL